MDPDLILTMFTYPLRYEVVVLVPPIPVPVMDNIISPMSNIGFIIIITSFLIFSLRQRG